MIVQKSGVSDSHEVAQLLKNQARARHSFPVPGLFISTGAG
jgi:hypothetical protein